MTHDPRPTASDSERTDMGKMKDLITDDWDRAYAEGYRKGYLTALRWAFDAFEALQNEQPQVKGKP